MGTLLGRGGGGGSTSITTTNTVVSLYSCNIIPIRPDVLLLCSKNDQAVHLMDDKNGEIVASFNGNNFKENEQKNDKKLTKFKTDFTFACTSALSRYIYALGTDNTITVFDFDNKTIEKVFNPHDSALITTICHHPHRNILATTSSDGFIKIWK
jgi:WD40 repeat-containing protein SMU1